MRYFPSIFQLVAGIIVLTFSTFSFFFFDFFNDLFNGVPYHMIVCILFLIAYYIMITYRSAKSYSFYRMVMIMDRTSDKATREGYYHDDERIEAERAIEYNKPQFKIFWELIFRPLAIFLFETIVLGGIGIVLCIFLLNTKWYYGFFFFTLVLGVQFIVCGTIGLIRTHKSKHNEIDF